MPDPAVEAARLRRHRRASQHADTRRQERGGHRFAVPADVASPVEREANLVRGDIGKERVALDSQPCSSSETRSLNATGRTGRCTVIRLLTLESPDTGGPNMD